MAALYLESSAVLTWLLVEQRAAQVRRAVDSSEAIITATFTQVETERALIRAQVQGVITQADHARLRGLLARESAKWALLEMTRSVRTRASERFPVEPIRSLDAIHLASALEAHELYSDLEVLSFDQRILDNLVPLGLKSAEPSAR